MDILNDDVLIIIISYFGKHAVEVYLLNFVSKRFNGSIKTMGLECIAEEYFKQITIMNKPNMYNEFKNTKLPLYAFLEIMDFASKNDYVDIVKYFYENNVKGRVSKNSTVNFYFTKNIVKYMYKIAHNSDNVKTYLRSMNLKYYSEEDKIYEMSIYLSKNEKNIDRLTRHVLNNENYDYIWGDKFNNIFDDEL